MRAIPSVRRGIPEANEAGEYERLTIGGATVYAHNSLNEFPGLEIDAESGFFGQKLVMRGVKQEQQGCCG